MLTPNNISGSGKTILTVFPFISCQKDIPYLPSVHDTGDFEGTLIISNASSS